MMLGRNDVEAMVSTWPGDSWTSRSAQHLATAVEISTLDKSAIKLICENVRLGLRNGFGSVARDWAALGLALTRGKLLDEVKFVDVFRPSTYDADHLKNLAWVSRQLSNWCVIHLPSHEARLNSWAHYNNLAQTIAADEAQLTLQLKRNPRAIPTLLTLTEEAFARSMGEVVSTLPVHRDHAFTRSAGSC